MTTHLRYLVYAFFFSAGMPWLIAPGTESLKWFQVALILTILTAVLTSSVRSIMFRIMSLHSLLILAIIFWVLFATISTLFYASRWSVLDIQKFLFYVIFSFSLAAIIIHQRDKISIPFCGLATLLGIAVAMIFSFSTIINDIPPLTFLAIANAEPSYIIHGIFAKGDATAEGLGGGRATLLHNATPFPQC